MTAESIARNALNMEFNRRAGKHGLEVVAYNATLWRYFDLPRFVHMLARKTLSLIRLDKFDDQWEGFVPPLQRHEYQGLFAKKDLMRDQARHRRTAEQRKAYYASCWHLSDSESDGMWKLYAKDGLAIRTTYQSLIYSLRNDPRKDGLIIGKVRYKRQSPGCSMLQACMTKREPFAHEKEMRVIWHNKRGTPNADEPVVQARCDLKQLIEEVVVSPRSERFLDDLVRDLVEKYDLKEVRVTRSAMSEVPTA